MEKGSVISGFRVTNVREIHEIDARLWEMRHDKSGAQLVWLDRADDNKTFSISFKTVPEDSTGVFHILEHSVLCGSDRYPVKEPFVELLKSSVQTFLNAMTYPDKTVYPVSSRNDADFLNLVSIYMDAVLHPAIYHKPEIFRQEGWRYEFGEDGGVAYQGVVLNEMKGAYSSPKEMLYSNMFALLFPDNCYRHESGGHPAHIPDLTYEAFLDNHRKFYHPSNAHICLVGRVKLDDVLPLIDGFLREYDAQPACFDIPMQVPKPCAPQTASYEIGADEPTQMRAIAARGAIAGRFDEREKMAALEILVDYLAGDNDAPLKKAVLESGLGQDFRLELNDYMQQAWLMWSVWNTDADKRDAINETVRGALRRIVDEGLDHERLRAAYNKLAFRMRDREYESPRSLEEALTIQQNWNYGGDPAQLLLVEDVLAALAGKLDGGYFLALIRELLLDNPNSASLLLTPSVTLGEETRRVEAERIARESAAWTDGQRQALVEAGKALLAWQQAPDTPEALASIPMLKLSDLDPEPARVCARTASVAGRPVLRHDGVTDIAYLNLHFAAADLGADELPCAGLLGSVLGKLGTKRHSSEQLQLLVKRCIGRLSFQAGVYPGSANDRARLYLKASAAFIRDNAAEAADIVREILTETDFADTANLQRVVAQLNMDEQMALTTSGHRFAFTHAAATQTAQGAARELTGGYEYAKKLKAWSETDDLSALAADLGAIAERTFTGARLTVGASALVTDADIAALAAAFPAGTACPAEAALSPLAFGFDRIAIPAGIGYAGKAMNLRAAGVGYSGGLAVLANILNFNYLWNEVRVKGGAYGVGFRGMQDGEAVLYSFRDPNPGRTLDTFGTIVAYIRSFCAAPADLTRFILGSVAELDPYLSAQERIATAEERYFNGVSPEMVRRWYGELIGATQADLLRLADAIGEAEKSAGRCVIAAQPMLDAIAE